MTCRFLFQGFITEPISEFLAENVAKECQISRQQQDEYAVESQRRTQEAIKADKFQKEIVPITVKDRKGQIVIDRDEFPKSETSLASLSKLRPAFVTVIISNLSIRLFFNNYHFISINSRMEQ